jgi:hypothetical protein
MCSRPQNGHDSDVVDQDIRRLPLNEVGDLKNNVCGGDLGLTSQTEGLSTDYKASSNIFY